MLCGSGRGTGYLLRVFDAWAVWLPARISRHVSPTLAATITTYLPTYLAVPSSELQTLPQASSEAPPCSVGFPREPLQPPKATEPTPGRIRAQAGSSAPPASTASAICAVGSPGRCAARGLLGPRVNGGGRIAESRYKLLVGGAAMAAGFCTQRRSRSMYRYLVAYTCFPTRLPGSSHQLQKKMQGTTHPWRRWHKYVRNPRPLKISTRINNSGRTIAGSSHTSGRSVPA